MSKTIYAIVKEPMITINSGYRVSCFQDFGSESAHCGHCGREFNYTPDNSGTDICGLACSKECLKAIESQFFKPLVQQKIELPQEQESTPASDDIPGDVEVVETPKIVKEDRPATCPGCDGPRYKRGYKHTDDCSMKKPVYTPSGNVCSECGGSARGRGFAHKDGCKVVADLKAKYGAKYASK